jgi:glycosyltransferase involved in cell wall biosynthesis
VELAAIIVLIIYFVLPSVYELYANSVTEAVGYGLPVICTDKCGSRYHIKDGYNGDVIKSNSLKDLLRVLENCAANRAHNREMSHNALSYASENISTYSFLRYFDIKVIERFNISMH